MASFRTRCSASALLRPQRQIPAPTPTSADKAEPTASNQSLGQSNSGAGIHSPLQNPRDVFEAALGEIKRNNEIGGRRGETGERIGGSETEDLVPDQQLAKID